MSGRVLLSVVKVIGGTLAVIVLLEVFLFIFFTFTRVEWVYGESWGGELQEVQDNGLGVLTFRFDDYGSTDGTYELILFGDSEDLMDGAKARAIRRCSHSGILQEEEFPVRKTADGACRLTLTPEFVPSDEDETLKIEIACPQACEEGKTMLLEFKSESVRHFKSI